MKNLYKSKYLYFILFFFITIGAFSQTFNDLKGAGDAFFNKKNWVEAKKSYERANKLNADKYCADRSAECDKRIALERNKFVSNIQKADEYFKSGLFDDAKKLYQEALVSRKDDYCKNRIVECECWLALERSDANTAEVTYKQFESKNRKIDIELRLAQIYSEQKSDSKALEWYRKVADDGNKQAMKSIGIILLKTGKDDLIALEWINKSGEDTAPYYRIAGDRIWNTAGMQTSKYEDAFVFFRKSNYTEAELKNRYNELGDILSKMNKEEEANFWYSKGGKDLRVRTYEEGIRHEGYNRYDKAEEAYLKAATGGYLEAYKKLGDLYWNGFSENAKNSNRYLLSIPFYEKSNTSTLSEIYLKAAKLYIGDKTFIKDAEQLLIKITKLEQKDDKTAQAYYLLGSLYYEDSVVKKDWVKSEQFLKAGAEMKHTPSERKLADLYIRRKRYNEAFLWLSELDKQNDSFGTFGMGKLIYDGSIKNQKNAHEEGIKLIIKAAEMGNKDAIGSLKNLSDESNDAKSAYEKLSKN
jgi:TPR repeat protein